MARTCGAISACMVWDLGKAMRKKEEFESARLMDFEFRHRARAMRLLAEQTGLDPDALASETVLHGDAEIIDSVARQTGVDRAEIADRHGVCLVEARRQLIGERGDPTPYRLG